LINDSPPFQARKKGSLEMKKSIRRFGGFLAGMITPQISAFIAWGLTMDNLSTL
jgi:mannitol-specific phosphotransferase system IIBC component